MQWFRFYVETISDSKIRRLPIAHRWLWVVVLTMARTSPQPGKLMVSDDVPATPEDISDAGKIPVDDTVSGLSALLHLGLLNRDDAGAYVVTKWHERQYESDTSAERTKKWRERKRADNVTSHERHNGVTVTAPDTDTESDTEIREEKKDDPPDGDIDDVTKLIRLYESEGFGQLTQFVSEDMEALVQEYPVQWIVHAMKKAVSANARSMNYIKACLRDWRANGGLKDKHAQRRNVKGATNDGSHDDRYSEFYKLYPDA